MNLTFQSIIAKLHTFWQEQGCLITHPYDMEKGSATLSPYTFLRSLGPEPWAVAYLDPCRRPIDSRYAKDKTDRYQWYYQYQVLIKPAIAEPQEVVLKSLATLGVTREKHEIEFIDDLSESPVFGAKLRGWEVWLDGAEITQISYLDQVGGIDCDPLPLEVAYGLERLSLKVQGIDSFDQIQWDDHVTYGELYKQAEFEQSVYNCESSSLGVLQNLLSLYLQETECQLQKELVYPSLDYLLKCSHTLNLLEARKAISKEDLDKLVTKTRNLATCIGKLYIKKRGALGFPLLKNT